MYASVSLFRDLKLPLESHEIVGNLHISFKFECGGPAHGSRIVNHQSRGERPLNTQEPEQSRYEPTVSTASRAGFINSGNVATASQAGSINSATAAVSVPTPMDEEKETSSSLPKRPSFTINSREREEEADFPEPILLRLCVRSTGEGEKGLRVKHRNLEGNVSEQDIGAGKELVVTTPLFLPGPEGNLHNR